MKAFTFPQYSDEWWAARRGVPTASEFGNIITPAKGQYAAAADTYINQLIADKFDPCYGPKDEFATAAMRNGTILEPEARRFYEFERDAEVKQIGFCMSDDRRWGSSPDGLTAEGALELKCPTMAVHVGYLRDGVLPPKYLAQCHGHLIVTGREYVDFMSYCFGLPPLLVRVEPDEFTTKLRECLDRFWGEYQEALAKIEATLPPLPEPPPTQVMDFGTLGTVEVQPGGEAFF